VVDVDWSDATEVVPAVLTALGMPFTYSANGVAFGFIAYAGLKLLTGRAGAGDGVGHRCRLPVQVLLPAGALSTAA
jgi:xanthine/uracil/vitamin C permease (AzgA family)